MMKRLVTEILLATVVCGCSVVSPATGSASTPATVQTPGALPSSTATPPSPATAPTAPTAVAPPRYRCDNGTEFSVRFADDDTAVVDTGANGSEKLLRDAGGVTPQQSVYSNPRLRAEFGLGTTGREALLRYPQPPQVVHCAQP